MAERMIIAGYDGSEQALDGLALASVLALRPDTRLIVASVYRQEPAGYQGGDYQEALRSIAESSLLSAARRIPYGVRFETRAIAARQAGPALAQLAIEEQAEAVVLGSCHRGPVGSVLLGSVAEYVSRHAPSGVAIAPRGYADSAEGVHNIAVAFDGRAQSWQALARAAELAKGLRARLRILSVLSPGPGSANAFTPVDLSIDRREDLERALEEARASLDPSIDVSCELLVGPPAACLAEACAHDVDLLVTGSRGHGALRRTLLGSVSAVLMRSARCPVFVVAKASVESSGQAAA